MHFCNDEVVDGIPEISKTAKMKIRYLYNHIFNKTFPDVVSIQLTGKKEMIN